MAVIYNNLSFLLDHPSKIYIIANVVFSLITRTLGAKSVTIAEETERLRQLEAAVFNDFRRDIRKKLRMQGVKVCMSACVFCLSVCVLSFSLSLFLLSPTHSRSLKCYNPSPREEK